MINPVDFKPWVRELEVNKLNELIIKRVLTLKNNQQYQNKQDM